jgi:hypothetical protein
MDDQMVSQAIRDRAAKEVNKAVGELLEIADPASDELNVPERLQ